jgi:hypothetical protein
MHMKNILRTLSIVAALVFVCSCKHKDGTPSSGNVYIYSFEDSRILTLDDSKKTLEKFLGAVDTGSLYKSDENTVYYVSKNDVTETFEQDLNNGNFTFKKGFKKYLGEYAPRLPNKEEAIRAAEEYLGKNALFPNDRAQLKMVHYGGIRSNSVIDGKKPGPIVEKLLTLTYGRLVDGTPVIGPGSKIIAQIGEGGEVVGLVRRWREVGVQSRKQVQPEEMISQQEAEEMAGRQIHAQYGESASYKILGSGKTYYDNNGKILQPVYTFETTIDLKDKQVKPFDYLCVIPMLRQSPEPLQLTAVDPKAKELIRNIKRGEPLPTPPNEGDVTD